MSTNAVLIGFCRALPNVKSFVLPVFLDGQSRQVVQEIDERGCVTGFCEVDTSVGFQRTSFPLGAQVAAPAVYGYELHGDSVAIGHAALLARLLERHFEDGDLVAGGPVPRVVKTFIQFARTAAVGPAEATSFLMDFGRITTLQPYALQDTTLLRSQARYFPQGREDWEEQLCRRLAHPSGAIAEEHDQALRNVRALAANDRESDHRELASAAAALLDVSNVFGHVLVRYSGSVCMRCLFRIGVDFPRADGLEGMIDIARRITRDTRGIIPARTAFARFALQFLAENIHVLAMMEQGDEALTDRLCNTLTELLNDPLYAGDAQQALAQIAVDTQRPSLVKPYILELQLVQGEQPFAEAIASALELVC